MTLSPTPLQSAYRDLLIELHDWQAERKARELAFYRKALENGELSVVEGKEQTTRKCKCDICLSLQMPGARKFWYRGKSGGFWWFHPCVVCWNEIAPSADFQLPVVVVQTEA